MQSELARDVLHELRHAAAQNALLTRRLVEAEKARAAADRAASTAIAQADRAERAERQIAADRDRWKALALQHEAALRALSPVSHCHGKSS